MYFCVSGILGGESVLSPLMWTRGEMGTSASRAQLRSDRHSQFLGVTQSWACARHVVCF